MLKAKVQEEFGSTSRLLSPKRQERERCKTKDLHDTHSTTSTTNCSHLGDAERSDPDSSHALQRRLLVHSQSSCALVSIPFHHV